MTDKSPIEILEQKEFCDMLSGMLYQLTERQRFIVESYVLDEWKLKNIADVFGVTKERIRQIKAKALRLMRHNMFNNQDVSSWFDCRKRWMNARDYKCQ